MHLGIESPWITGSVTERTKPVWLRSRNYIANKYLFMGAQLSNGHLSVFGLAL